MKSFAELLTLYIKQAGITDTELARAIGVSRQTIFRWRTGITGRPNYREDVIAIAKKLRLTPDERDALLLAGGFRPDDITLLDREQYDMVNSKELHGDAIPHSEKGVEITGKIESKGYSRFRGGFGFLADKSKRFVFFSIVLVILLVIGAWLVTDKLLFDDSDDDNISQNQTESPEEVSYVIEPAAPGEILLLVTRLGNIDTDLRITEQIITILKRESESNRFSIIRIEEYPQILGNNNQAIDILQKKKASMIIYGECNNSQANVNILSSSEQIPTVIMIDDDDTVSMNVISLITLGKICIDNNNTEQALSFLYQARNLLKDNSMDSSIITIVDELLTEINVSNVST